MPRTLTSTVLAVTLAVGALTGCPNNAPPPPPPPPADPNSPAGMARTKFDTLCAACHGMSGKGDGAAGAALNPKPRDYTDAAWQAAVTDAELAKAIVEGGAAIGKSPTMPANPDLKDQPEVVNELVKIIRSFKQ